MAKRGRKPLHPNQETKRVGVCLTDEQYQLVQEVAAKLGTTPGGLVRQLLDALARRYEAQDVEELASCVAANLNGHSDSPETLDLDSCKPLTAQYG